MTYVATKDVSCECGRVTFTVSEFVTLSNLRCLWCPRNPRLNIVREDVTPRKGKAV